MISAPAGAEKSSTEDMIVMSGKIGFGANRRSCHDEDLAVKQAASLLGAPH